MLGFVVSTVALITPCVSEIPIWESMLANVPIVMQETCQLLSAVNDTSLIFVNCIDSKDCFLDSRKRWNNLQEFMSFTASFLFDEEDHYL